MSVPAFEQPMPVITTPFVSLLKRIDAMSDFIIVNDLGNRAGFDQMTASDLRRKMYVVKGEYRSPSFLDLVLRRDRGHLMLAICPDRHNVRRYILETYGCWHKELPRRVVRWLIDELTEAGISTPYDITLRNRSDTSPMARHLDCNV